MPVIVLSQFCLQHHNATGFRTDYVVSGSWGKFYFKKIMAARNCGLYLPIILHFLVVAPPTPLMSVIPTLGREILWCRSDARFFGMGTGLSLVETHGTGYQLGTCIGGKGVWVLPSRHKAFCLYVRRVEKRSWNRNRLGHKVYMILCFKSSCTILTPPPSQNHASVPAIFPSHPPAQCDASHPEASNQAWIFSHECEASHTPNPRSHMKATCEPIHLWVIENLQIK